MYATSFMAHYGTMIDGIRRIGAAGRLSFDSLHLEVTRGDRYLELTPNIWELPIADKDKVVPARDTGFPVFLGWRPSQSCTIELMTNKLSFKQFCQNYGLRTPAMDATIMKDEALVLIKEVAVGETHRAIVGPITLRDALASPEYLNGERYIEAFVEGDPLQAWYYNGKLACVEVRTKPVVQGDGCNTLRELISWITSPFNVVDWQVVEAITRVQSFDLDSIVPAGKSVVVDIRFSSALLPTVHTNENKLPQLAGTKVGQQLLEAGPIFLKSFPDAVRNTSIFRIDGVLDAQQNVWFMDIGRERVVHPDVYPIMLKELLGNKELSGSVGVAPLAMIR
jgi:hypothetical protein